MNPFVFTPAGDNLVQVMTMAFCVGVIYRWIRLYRRNWRVRPVALYPVIIAGLTLVFYVIVLFTDLNELNTVTFVVLSALLRLFIMALLYFAAKAMEPNDRSESNH